MVDVKVKPVKGGGFDVIGVENIAVRCRTKRIADVAKILIIENLYDADWVARVLNTYGDRVAHRGDKPKGKKR